MTTMPIRSAADNTSLNSKGAHSYSEKGNDVPPEAPAATGAVDQFGGALERSAEEKALVRKLDMRIMPMLFAMYFLNYLDRNAIAQARINTLEDDLGLTGNQFNTCVSLLFVGYTLAQLPSNMAMATKRIRPSLWMAGWMMAWAVVSACTALVKDFHGLVGVRFVLGITEAPLYPGAIYMMALFYPRREIATRVSIFYSANTIATACSGLIAAATFATLDGVHGIEGWRWLFIIEGIVTFAIGILAIYILPDHPTTTRWLTPAEREFAQARMDRDTVGLQESRGVVAGLKDSAKDGKLWLLVVMQTCHLASCGFNSFFPTVIRTLGYSSTITLVMTCPPYLAAAASSITFAMLSGRFNERSWHITVSMIFAIVGFVMACTSLQVAVRYTACFIFAIGAYGANSIILGWVSATCGQTSEKKASSLAIVNLIANASFAYTPFLYDKSTAPRYIPAMAANAAFSFAVIVCVWILRVWLQRTNKTRREQGENTLFFAY